MKHLIRTLIFAVLALASLSAFGQCPAGSVAGNQPCVTGQYNAIVYNYGGQPNSVAPDPLFVDVGNAATGSATITVRVNAFIKTIYGDSFMPLATNAAILVGGQSNQELVTPSAVSCPTPSVPGSCTFTATFLNVHGTGERIQSGTFGAQEALNRASISAGGYAQVDQLWTKAGGTTAMLAGTATGLLGNVSFVANTPYFPNAVWLKDVRTNNQSYWYGTPGLTVITIPTALTTAGGAAATLKTATTGGTIATATTPRFCITLEDQFGSETGCSADAAGTATLVDGAGSTNSYTVACPALTAGVVGCRLYVSASGAGTQTETLADSTTITCAVAAPLAPLNGTCGPGLITLTKLPATTNPGPPQGTSGAATVLNSAHTTVVNKQAGIPPLMLPFADTFGAGSFPVTVVSTTTLAAGFDVMGEIQYPAGLFNIQGQTMTICGGGTTTPSAATVAGTWNLRIGPRENSAGTSTEVAVVPITFVASTMWTAAANTFEFCTDVTTTTAGASGVLEGHGSYFCAGPATGTAAGVTGCSPWFNAASTAQDLTQQGVIQLSYVQTAASWTVPQLRYFSIRRK